MELYKRIRLRREELGMSQSELARRLGYKDRSTIAKIEAGINDITQTKIEAFAKALNTTASELMGWDDTAGTEFFDEDSSGLCLVQYAGPVAAHFDATPVEEHEYRSIPLEWLGRRKPEDFFIAVVDGNSMYPHFQNGDELLCLRCSDMGCSGRIGILVFGNEEATLKRIEYQPGEDWIDLVPINPEYQTRRIQGADLEQCRIVGRVIKVIRTVDEA